MNIECGRYTIHSDAFCLWITERCETKKEGVSTGKYTDKLVAGYVQNLEELMDDFIDRKTRNSDAVKLKELLKDIAKAEKNAKEIVKAVESHGKAKASDYR